MGREIQCWCVLTRKLIKQMIIHHYLCFSIEKPAYGNELDWAGATQTCLFNLEKIIYISNEKRNLSEVLESF